MTGRQAIVRWDGRRAGLLRELSGDLAGKTAFANDASWLADPTAVPVSLTLPLREAPYESSGLHPFFENLLPEGWLLELSTAKLKLSKGDAFGLLAALCRDCPGAVEILPWEEEA